MKAGAALALAITLIACNFRAEFEDCRVTCTATSGCPSGLTCAASEGWCRTGETAAACLAVDGDSGSCISYFDDQSAFASATSSLTANVEDFSRTANGSATPNAFVIQGGDYFFWHNRVTFRSVGVNQMPGTTVNTIAVGGSAAPNPTTIMSQLQETARDGITAVFATPESAVSVALQDDDGAQAFALDVVATSGMQSFSIPSSHAPFAGVVSSCGAVIMSVSLSPPVPSQWWRLDSVSFGP